MIMLGKLKVTCFALPFNHPKAMSSKYTSLPSEEPKRAARSKKKTNEQTGPAFAAYRDAESPQASPTLHAFDDTDALLTTQPWEALASSRKRTLGEGENGSHPNLQTEEQEEEEEGDVSEEEDSATEVDNVDRPLAPMPRAVWFILGTCDIHVRVRTMTH